MSNEDPCPQCGGAIEYDEADVGVGVIRGNAGCPACHWTPPPIKSVYKPRERTDAEHLADFVAHGGKTPHTLAVAREIVRLQAYTRTTEAAFADLAVAEERNVWLTSRVDGLLEANNRYVEEARAARRELVEAKTATAILARQLTVMREALEFYADAPDAPDDDDNTVAEQALQDVFGDAR